MKEEKVWLDRLIMYIEQPEAIEKQISTVRRYTLLTIVLAVITLLLEKLGSE
jgi:hypothetical protein